MKTVLVDSNVLLDIATNDKTWFEWSSQALESAANEAPLAINAIIARKSAKSVSDGLSLAAGGVFATRS